MRVKDLTKQYDGKTVVDSVSFEIPKGKVISMIGPNGAGKSTVLNIISRLIARDSGLVATAGTSASGRARSWPSGWPSSPRATTYR